MLLEEITKLVGDFPSGYDALFYVCGVISFFTCLTVSMACSGCLRATIWGDAYVC